MVSARQQDQQGHHRNGDQAVSTTAYIVFDLLSLIWSFVAKAVPTLQSQKTSYQTCFIDIFVAGLSNRLGAISKWDFSTPVWGLGGTRGRGWTHSGPSTAYCYSPLTHMAYLLQFLSHFAGSNGVPVRQSDQDTMTNTGLG